MAQGRGRSPPGRGNGGRGAKHQQGGGDSRGGRGQRSAAIPPPPGLYGGSPAGPSHRGPAGAGAIRHGASPAGGRGAHSQGRGGAAGASGAAGRGAGRRGGGRHPGGARGGGGFAPYTAAASSGPPVPGALSGGVVNQYLHVEFDPRDRGVWKLSVPQGQRFSKHFLAGVEVWARQALQQGTSGNAAIPSPPPPPPPQASPLTAPPAVSASAVATSTSLLASASTSAAPPSSAYDFTSFLLPSTQAAPAAGTATAFATAGAGGVVGSGAFYQPSIEGRGPSGGGSEEAMYLDDIRGEGAPEGVGLGGEDELEEAGGASGSEEDGEEGMWGDGEEEAEEEEEEEGDEGDEEAWDEGQGEEEGEGEGEAGGSISSAGSSFDTPEEEDDAQQQLQQQRQQQQAGQGSGAFAPAPFTFSFDLGATSSSSAPAAAAAPSLSSASSAAVSKGRPHPYPAPALGAGAHGPASVRLPVSIHLERQGLTDVEVELLCRWYQERASGLLELSKLWLFENCIGDAGAYALAELFHPTLLEVHLSHNSVTNKGLRVLLGSVPAERPPGLRPLWLRCEWNVLQLEELPELVKQAAVRGVNIQLPPVVKAGGGADHEMRLDRRAPAGTHVQLPWISMQKQPPSESGVLKATRDAYRAPVPAAPPPAAPVAGKAASKPPTVTVQLPPPPPAPAAMRVSTSPDRLPATPPPPPPPTRKSTSPPRLVQPPAPSAAPSAAAPGSSGLAAGVGSEHYSHGPLLLFPDTSALLSMLGANTDVARPALTLDLLLQLASGGRFGRCLPAADQTFIVISDSVMKQLDGLKGVPECRVAVRKFLKEGLESMGSAGYDFLTLLGAHEGEGLLLHEGGGLGAAGSLSPFISSKGQRVDYKIVEVALYFMREVLAGAEQGSAGDDQGAGAAARHLPVMLLSNDNAQILAARAHGLPAFRLSSPGPLAEQLQALLSSPGSPALSSGVLRALLAPQATLGLGSAAGVSLQQHFDRAVANLRWLTQGLAAASGLMGKVEQLAACEGGDAAAALSGIRSLLQAPTIALEEADDSGASQETAGGGSGTAAVAYAAMAGALEEQLMQWEGLVKSHQAPSRLLRWAVQSAAQRSSMD